MSLAYTPAQLRAFAWLPADGGRRTPTGGYAPETMAFELDDLAYTTNFVEESQVPAGIAESYRLTPAGVAERARLVEMGEIK